jgi:hypothetical protein
MSWPEIKKSVNSNLDVPLNELIATTSDKQASAQYEIIYRQTAAQMISLASVNWALKKTVSVGNLLADIFNIEVAALRACTTIAQIVASNAAVTALAGSPAAMSLIVFSNLTRTAIEGSTVAITAINSTLTATTTISSGGDSSWKVYDGYAWIKQCASTMPSSGNSQTTTWSGIFSGDFATSSNNLVSVNKFARNITATPATGGVSPGASIKTVIYPIQSREGF